MTFDRQRNLKQHLFLDERFQSLPLLPRLLFLQLGWYSDDQGRERVNVPLMKGMMFALDKTVTESSIEDALLQLDESNLVALFAHGRDTYLQVLPWSEWFTVDRPKESLHPELSRAAREPLASRSRIIREPLAIQSRFIRGEGEGEREREGASVGDRREPLSNERPDPFCPAHPESTDEDCRACGNRRMILQRWLSERAERARGDDDA